MSIHTNIPQHTSDLRVTSETTIEDVAEFMAARLEEPAVIDVDVDGRAVIWNFNSHDLDPAALLSSDIPAGYFIVPYQVAGVWAAMHRLLPWGALPGSPRLLVYRHEKAEYAAYRDLANSPHLDTVPVDLPHHVVDPLDESEGSGGRRR